MFKNSSTIFFAVTKDFPLTSSVIIEVEAIEIAQPDPSKVNFSTLSLSLEFIFK